MEEEIIMVPEDVFNPIGKLW